MGWLSDYKYRKKLTITGSMGAGNGYQVLLKIGESAGAVGVDFNLEGHALNFPNDIRFTADDGTTEYSYWIESIEGTAPDRVVNVWVKIDANLDTDAYIYVYYGKDADVSASNGYSTFEFFDDFEDGIIDTMWDVSSLSSAVEENGVLTIIGAPDSYNDPNSSCAETNFVFNSDFRIVGAVEYIENQPNKGCVYLGLIESDGFIWVGIGYNPYNNSYYYSRISGKISKSTSSSYPRSDNVKLIIQRFNGVIKTYVSNYRLVNVSNYFDDVIGIRLINAVESGYNSIIEKWDYVYVTKFVDPEPTFFAVDLEEIKNVNAEWYLDYRYRKKITVTSVENIGHNYEVMFKIGESATATGCDFNLDGKSLNFPNDIRFTKKDGITPLEYFIEWVDGVAPNRVAKIWLEVSDNTEADTDVYIYYGKYNAKNNNNIHIFSAFVDDFNRGWLGDGTDIWNVWIEGNGRAYIDYDGRAILESDELKGTSIIFKHNIPSTTQFELHYKFYREIVSPGANEVWLNLYDVNGNMFRVGYSVDYYYAQQLVDGNFITLEQIPRQSPNEFKCVKFVYTTDNLYYYENDVLIGTYANPFSADVEITFGFSSWDLSRMILDDFFFRTIYATEPTFVVDAVVEEAKILYGIFECLLAKKNDFRYVTLNSIGVDWINKHIVEAGINYLHLKNMSVLNDVVKQKELINSLGISIADGLLKLYGILNGLEKLTVKKLLSELEVQKEVLQNISVVNKIVVLLEKINALIVDVGCIRNDFVALENLMQKDVRIDIMTELILKMLKKQLFGVVAEISDLINQDIPFVLDIKIVTVMVNKINVLLGLQKQLEKTLSSVLDVQKLEEINFNILVELVETAQDLLVICRTLIETADKYLTDAEKVKLYDTIYLLENLYRTIGGVLNDKS